MMRNARNRSIRGGEGIGGHRCVCCRSHRPNKSYRAAEKRQWRKDHTV